MTARGHLFPGAPGATGGFIGSKALALHFLAHELAGAADVRSPSIVDFLSGRPVAPPPFAPYDEPRATAASKSAMNSGEPGSPRNGGPPFQAYQ